MKENISSGERHLLKLSVAVAEENYGW